MHETCNGVFFKLTDQGLLVTFSDKVCSAYVAQMWVSSLNDSRWMTVNRQERSHTLPTHSQSHTYDALYSNYNSHTLSHMRSYTLSPAKKHWILPQTIRILPSLCFKRRSELIYILTLKMWRWWHMMTMLGLHVDASAVKHTQYFRKRPSRAEWTFQLVSIVLPHCSERPLSLLCMWGREGDRYI